MVGSRDSRDVTKTPAVPSFSISLCLIFSSVSFHALAKSQKSFSPQCEKDSSVKPMLTAQCSESTQLTFGKNLIGCVWVNYPPLRPMTMSRGQVP